MNTAKPIDLIRTGCISEEDYNRCAPILADQMKNASMTNCREIIALVKKIIKDKHAAPTAKVRVLKLFHACMMVANTNFLLHAQKKIMSRFTILAKHRKNLQEETRGDDIFGSVSGASEENRDSSREFLILLLQYLQTWASQFGKAPDGKPSGFLAAYNQLVKEGVNFPKKSARPRNSLEQPSRSPPQPAARLSNPSTPIVSPPYYEKNNQLKARNRSKDESTIQRIESAIQLYNDLYKAGERGDTLEECLLALKSLKSELEREISNFSTDSPESIEIMFEINDRLQHIIDVHKTQGSVNKRPYETAPSQTNSQSRNQPNTESLLDLDLFSTPPPSQPSVSQSAAFSNMSFATHNPRLQMNFQSQSSPDYPGLSPTLPKDDSDLRTLRIENERLKNLVNHRQENDATKMNQLNILTNENQELRKALEEAQQHLYQHMEVVKKLTFTCNQLNQELLEAKQTIERFGKQNAINGSQSNLKNGMSNLSLNPPQNFENRSSLVYPPQKEKEVQIIPNPFDSESSSDEIPHSSLEFPIQNDLFYRICNCIERGVLFDDDFIQVGIQVALNESDVIAMIYIGNKGTSAITELHTEVTSFDKEGLSIMINPLISTDPISQGSQATRMIRATLKDFTGNVPKMILKIKQGFDLRNYYLNLPITIARFLQGLQRPAEELWAIWDRLAFKEEKISCDLKNVRNIQELSQHVCLAGAFRIYPPQEIPQLNQNQFLAAGQKGVSVFILVSFDGESMKSVIAVRSESAKLRESILEIIDAQIS